MTKTKRILTILLMAILSVMVALTFTACGGGDDNDDNGGSNSVVCTVTEAQFNTAKDAATYSAFKVVGSNTLKVNGVVDTNESSNITYILAAEGMFVGVGNDESYFQKTADGYYGYTKVEGEWVKVTVQQTLYDSNRNRILTHASPAALIGMYGLTLDALTYNEAEKCYVFSQGDSSVGITATIKIYFENGKVVKIATDATNAIEQEQIISVMNYSYSAADLVITYPNVGGDNSGDNSGNEGEQPGVGDEGQTSGLGVYKFKSMTFAGITYEVGDEAPWGDVLTADSNQILLAEDGNAKAASVVDGHIELQAGTWSLDGESISITIEGMTQTGTLKDGLITLTFSANGQNIVYVYEFSDEQPDFGGGDVEQGPQDCQLIPTEFFDENGVFPKSYRCTCGDASHNVTNSCIKITSAEEFRTLVSMLNEEANIGTLTIEIQNDIDLGGATIPALKAYDYQYRGRVFTLAGVDGGVTISNFTVVADQEYLAAGLFGCVTGDLTIKNITLSNMTINENDEVVAGAFVGLYMPAGDEETASGLRIENCSVVNSSITAGCVGGIYGIAISELSDVRLIWVDGVKVQNCGLNGIVFAGGLMGIGAQGLEKEMISVSMNDYTLLGNTITSSVDNQAGLYIGMFGNAKIVFEYSTVGNEDKINGNTVTANDVANDTRDYGRTGWASETDATYVWVGTSPMINNYSQGVH